jgi:hypothetical protein
MSRLVRVVLCAAVAAAAGCKDDKLDNSKIQTPNDVPLGPPKPIGGPAGGLKGREARLDK